VSIAHLRKFISSSNSHGQNMAFLTACFTFVWLLGPPASELKAQELHPSETQVKAAYLYNFGKFVTGTSTPTTNSEYQICILGKDPFGPVLDSTVSGEKIGGRAIRVVRLSSLQGMAPCNVLYISPSEAGRLASILQATQRVSVLTVSDIPRFAERGGTIGLVSHEGKIRFEVNRASAQQKQLTLSSELLKVAIRVIDQSAQVK